MEPFVPAGFPLRPDAVLIVGSQRSGTTLMRLVLEAHPSFRCFDEKTAYRILGGLLEALPSDRRPVYKIPRYTEQLDAPPWSDFGAPPAVVTYGGQPVVFMVRDPLDAAASILRLRDGAWYDTWLGPILDARARRDPRFAERWSADRARAEAGPSPRAAIAACYWVYKTEALERYRASGMPVFAVGYERLVSEPEPVLRALLAALGAPWDESVLLHHRRAHAEVEHDGLTVGDTDPARAIDPDGIGGWRAVLDAAGADEVRRVAGPLCARLGIGPSG
jgi:hypothetical protein